MKRLALLISAVMAVVMTFGLVAAPPALADGTYHGKNCSTYYSGSGEKSFQMCVSTIQGDGGPVWGRFEIWAGPTGVDPYRVWMDETVALKNWNANATCVGYYPGCSGAGSANGINAFSLPNTYGGAITRDTDHYAASEHLCVNKTIQWGGLNFIWSQNQPSFTGVVPDSDQYNSYPNCTS